MNIKFKMKELYFNIEDNIIAVYCLWINNERVYLGKTKNLKQRLYQYKDSCNSNEAQWKKEVNKITYFECNNLTDLDILETYLINEYNPVQNVEKQFGSKSTYEIKIPKECELKVKATDIEKYFERTKNAPRIGLIGKRLGDFL